MCAGFNAKLAFNRSCFSCNPPHLSRPYFPSHAAPSAEDFRDFSGARSYNSIEGETRVPIAFPGSVWSKSFRSRMARLHGGIKAREIMYWYMAFLEFNPLARRRCHALPIHSSFHIGSV